jgi:heme/copper-type cytochrome/quinol oxidase subunit 1
VWNVLVTVGHGLMVVTVFGFVGVAISSFTGDQSNAAGDDPWDGQTLEWATASPAPTDNFAEIHTVASATPLLDLKPARTSSEGEKV